MTTNQTIDGVPREQMACIPVERCYDVRVKMIIAFNEAKKAGGDLDEALDAAYKSALRYSPNPASAEQPAPVAVVPKSECPNCLGDSMFGCDTCIPEQAAPKLPEREPGDDGVCTESHYAKGWNDCLDEVTRLNPSL